jgi:hypothetical protein
MKKVSEAPVDSDYRISPIVSLSGPIVIYRCIGNIFYCLNLFYEGIDFSRLAHRMELTIKK